MNPPEKVYIVNSPYYSERWQEILCTYEECVVEKHLFTVSASGVISTHLKLQSIPKPVNGKYCYNNMANAIIASRRKIQAFKNAFNKAPEGTPLKGFKMEKEQDYES